MTEAEGNTAVRRIVTRVDEQDKAVVLFDGPREGVSRPGRKVVSNLIWATDRSPAGFSNGVDFADTHKGITPAKQGSIFRILDYPPASPGTGTPPVATAPSVHEESEIRGLPPRHLGMHRTRTVDYVIVLSGEITMLLDDSEVHLKQGDVLVQQATNHAWVNRGTQTCRIAVILVDSEAP
ncbi:MAG TPA: cupin domain-containing protein [Devosiaceae bacterium]